MSQKTKIIVGVLAVSLFLCTGVCIVGWVIFRQVSQRILTTDPTEAARAAESIAEYDLPPGYHEERAMDLFQTRAITISPIESSPEGPMVPRFVLMQTSTAVMDDEQREYFRQQAQIKMERQLQGEGYNVKLVKEEKVNICEQEVTLFVYEGTDGDGQELREEVSDWFQVNGKPTFLMIVGHTQAWDETQVDAFVQSIRSTGPVAYYSFDDGTATDNSGHGNDGDTNNVRFVPGVRGQAVQFGGIDDPGYISVPNAPSLQISDSASYSLWVRVDDSFGQDFQNCEGQKLDGMPQMLIAKSGDRFGFVISAGVNPAKMVSLGSTFGAGDGSNHFVAGASQVSDVEMGTWLHVVHVFNQTGTSVYVNGQLLVHNERVPSFSTANEEDMFFGIEAGKGSCLPWWFPFKGALDEIRIYDHSLSESEIADLSHESQPKNERTPASHMLMEDGFTFAFSRSAFQARITSADGD